MVKPGLVCVLDGFVQRRLTMGERHLCNDGTHTLVDRPFFTFRREDRVSGSDEAAASGRSTSAFSAAQCRAARGLLGWSQEDLAAKVGLEASFVRDFEAETGDPGAGQVEVLRSALMAAGALFTDGDSPGVRLGQGAGDDGTRLGDLTTENDR